MNSIEVLTFGKYMYDVQVKACFPFTGKGHGTPSTSPRHIGQPSHLVPSDYKKVLYNQRLCYGAKSDNTAQWEIA